MRGNLPKAPSGSITEWYNGPAGLNMNSGYNFGISMIGTYPNKKVAAVPIVQVANLGIFPIDLKSAFPSDATKSGMPIMRFSQFYGFGVEINAVKDFRFIPNIGVGWGIEGGSVKYLWESDFSPIVMSQSTRISVAGFNFCFGYGLHAAYKDFGFSLNYVQSKSHFITFTEKKISSVSVDSGTTFDETETLTEYSKVKMPMRYIEFRFLYRLN